MNGMSTNPIMSKDEVRRALIIALDRYAIIEAIDVEGQAFSWPIPPGVPGHTPISELPESSQLLWSYQPELAKQMLADAGYPDGFTLELKGISLAVDIDFLNTLAYYWEEIGIDVNITVLDPAAYTATMRGVDYDILLETEFGSASPYILLNRASFDSTYRTWDNLEYNNMWEDMKKTVDTDERVAKMKELALFVTDAAAGGVGISRPYWLTCYWPWLKNYYGEITTGRENFMPMAARLWIDEDMKAEMGY
jgi:peptide/nickel transport system substrate-binding protein